MKSTATTIIVILVLIAGLGAGGWFLYNKFKVSADTNSAPVMDFNNDGRVDSLDLNMLLTAVSNKSDNPKYDLNNDDKVNTTDVDVFNRSWQANQPATGTL